MIGYLAGKECSARAKRCLWGVEQRHPLKQLRGGGGAGWGYCLRMLLAFLLLLYVIPLLTL